MTAKQWKMLEALDLHSGCGTIEVAMEYGELDAGKTHDNGEPDIGADWRLTQFVLGSIVRSLERKGLATTANGSWDITDRGRELIAKRRARSAGIKAMAAEVANIMGR